METLSKRLMDTFQNIQYNSYTPLEVKQLSEKWAEEIKNTAIGFAKKLMETKITALRGMNDEPEVRNSPDYALMKGELIINGDKLFEQFIEEYYV